jgi:threonylcarbamoyladenosine tRNA methylthiotransferase MtaB
VNVFFYTFGCKANQYDTAFVRQAFSDAGAQVVEEPDGADLAIVNSCTVTHESETKLRRYIRHQARAGRSTIVMGCAAALDDGRLATLPGVRAVVSGNDAAAVLRAAGFASPRVDPVLRRFTGSSRGWLRIQDGCDEHCTFCATTIARGSNRSRPLPDIVDEARAMAGHHAELVLTGVHIGSYGQDRDRGEARSLGELLEHLIGAVPDVRFRLSSIEATEVDDRLARLFIEVPRRLAAHLHAPLQSAADHLLRRMGRHWYTAATYRSRIEWLAERCPVLGLGADVIAGFPGESPADHGATLEYIEALPFTYLHVFPFSVRPGAAAARLAGRLPEAVVRSRARELRDLAETKGQRYRARRRGERADGVVCSRQGGKVEVLTEDYLTVYLSAREWGGQARLDLLVD